MFLILWYLSFRITPACAGKSSGQRPASMLPWDHPRVCGEKYPGRVIFYFIEGSPPRVRGKASYSSSMPASKRITPACAGKSLSSTGKIIFNKDHPRVCGEKSTLCPFLRSASGSPPRVRGKVQGATGGLYDGRITPACAGKSRWFSL